mmetsp:Transcript_96756/g.276319  ORF Transcript_96756/g.276319 Transcript_96756/m.276319 type:complete len:301 (-) Transcript_96756:532-1434(-)
MHSGTTGAAVVRRLEIQFGVGGVDIDGTNSAGAGGDIAGRAQYSHCTVSVMGYIALATQVVTGTAARGAVSVVEVISVNGTILARSEVPGEVASLAFVGNSHVLAVARGDGDGGFVDMRDALDLSLLWRYSPEPTTLPRYTENSSGASGRANGERLTCMSLCPSNECPAVLATGDVAGTLRLQGLPGFVDFCKDTKVPNGTHIGKMVEGGVRKVGKRLAARAMQAKDLAAEALDEAKVNGVDYAGHRARATCHAPRAIRHARERTSRPIATRHLLLVTKPNTPHHKPSRRALWTMSRSSH